MGKQNIHTIGELMPNTEIERKIIKQIEQLALVPIVDLKQQWRNLIGREPPEFAKRSFLTQVIAWEMQAKALGSIMPALHRQLLHLGSGTPAHPDASPAIRKLSSGVKLVRTWRGESHHVIVTDDGFLWQDKTFKSLSVIASEITSTRWSGPVFFGLRKSKLKQPSKLMAGGLLEDAPQAQTEAMAHD